MSALRTICNCKIKNRTKLAYSQTGNSRILFIGIALLAVVLGIYVQGRQNQTEPPIFEKTVLLPAPRAIQATTFTDHRGEAFGPEQFKDLWTIVFFGFTNCPDICPSTLRILKDVKEQVSQTGLWEGYQVVMVSVDPARDTPQKLGTYVPFFDAEFLGVTADLEETQEFAKSVGALFIKRENEQNDEWYDVDHSASLILINPQGQWAGAITAPHQTDQISNDLIKLANYHGSLKTAKADEREETPNTSASNITATSSTRKPTALQIKQAWIRPAPPNAHALAAYLEIHNTSAQDVTIVDIQSADFQISMIHDTEVSEGVASMRHLDKLIIPAGQRVQLEPLGKHIMLMQPKIPMALGSVTQVTFLSDQGQRFSTEIEVREQPE